MGLTENHLHGHLIKILFSLFDGNNKGYSLVLKLPRQSNQRQLWKLKRAVETGHRQREPGCCELVLTPAFLRGREAKITDSSPCWLELTVFSSNHLVTKCIPPYLVKYKESASIIKSPFSEQPPHTIYSELLVAFFSSFFPWACRRLSVFCFFFYTRYGLFENYLIIFIIIIHFSHFRFSFLQKCWCTNRRGALGSTS